MEKVSTAAVLWQMFNGFNSHVQHMFHIRSIGRQSTSTMQIQEAFPYAVTFVPPSWSCMAVIESHGEIDKSDWNPLWLYSTPNRNMFQKELGQIRVLQAQNGSSHQPLQQIELKVSDIQVAQKQEQCNGKAHDNRGWSCLCLFFLLSFSSAFKSTQDSSLVKIKPHKD